MRVGEHSRETRKYLDPVTVLLEMFPISEECKMCHTIIHLDNVRDTFHDGSNDEYGYFRAICWTCPICQHRHILSEDVNLIEAHNALIPSDFLRFEKKMRTVSAGALVFIALMFITIPLWAAMF